MEQYKKTTKDMIGEAMTDKGVSLERLSEMTSIPKHFLAALIDQDKKNIHPPPYVRGYLYKIAETLSLDANSLWQNYNGEIEMKTSGREDKLPTNRFAFKPMKTRKLIFAALAVVAVIAAAIFGNMIFRSPWIEIINPVSDNLQVFEPSIKVSGKISPQDKLIIEEEEIPVDENGYFEKEILLVPNEPNTIRFKVKRLLGKEIEVSRRVFYRL